MPELLERVPIWPADQVWCDGVSFFDKHLLPPNGMRASGYCIWRACQSDGFDDQPTAGIQLTELVEVAMQLLDGETPQVDYCIKLWGNGLCHILTPTNVTVAAGSDAAAIPRFADICAAIRSGVPGRRSIATVLAGFGATGAALLSELLADADVTVRRSAAWGLQRLDPACAAPILASALNDGDADVQHLAANAVWRRSRTAPELLPLLRQSTAIWLHLFEHPPVGRLGRLDVYDLLAWLAPTDSAVADAMTIALAKKAHRVQAAVILWNVAATTERVAYFQAALASDDPGWRVMAAISLWRMGVDAGDALLALAEASHTLEEQRYFAFLTTIAPTTENLPALLERLLRSDTIALRIWSLAACAAAELFAAGVDAAGKLLASHLPRLQRSLASDDPVVRLNVTHALSNMVDGPAAQPVN